MKAAIVIAVLFLAALVIYLNIPAGVQPAGKNQVIFIECRTCGEVRLESSP